MSEPIRWGILSTANIATKVGSAIQSATNADLLAIASRCENKAREWAEVKGVPKYYGSYDSLLNDEEIDAGTAVRDIWTSRLCPQRYRILLGTRDRLVGGVRGQLEQHRFGFYALIHYSWADAGIHDKSEQQEHLMLPVHPQTCSYTR